jgi:hypothetical protein
MATVTHELLGVPGESFTLSHPGESEPVITVENGEEMLIILHPLKQVVLIVRAPFVLQTIKITDVNCELLTLSMDGQFPDFKPDLARGSMYLLSLKDAHLNLRYEDWGRPNPHKTFIMEILPK